MMVWWSFRFVGGPHEGMRGGMNLAVGAEPPAERVLQVPGFEYRSQGGRFAVYRLEGCGVRRRRLVYRFLEFREARGQRRWSSRGRGKGWPRRPLGGVASQRLEDSG